MPRSAVKVTKSTSAYVRELNQRALDIEKQLQALSSTSSGAGGAVNAANHDKANQLRIPLCEVLADLLLTDAEYALQKDVVGRLWRLCFYSRIGPIRARIARDKRKQIVTEKEEKSLLFFLSEAITLYDYLTDKLQQKLIAAVASSTGRSLTQDTAATSRGGGCGKDDLSTLADSTASSSNPSTTGVVACLHRLYIHLGDLYRYSNKFAQAEKSYLTSARLGPGQGHAYNQLAVVCQVKKDQQGASPLSAVALYWYARSLLADAESFDTSKSNLCRLLASNREWLVQQQQQQKQPSEAETSGNNPTVKENKAIQSRTFLAQFVDLHYHFFQGLEPTNEVIYATVIDPVMDALHGMLKQSSFSEGLLCKLVVIHAFSECFDDYERFPKQVIMGKGDGFQIQHYGQVKQCTEVAARTATYQFGYHLANILVTKLQQQQSKTAKSSSSSASASFRHLLPLLLLSEYCAAYHVGTPMPGSHSEHYSKAFAPFWKRVVEAWNLLLPLQQQEGHDDDQTQADLELKEYQGLRGYQPFSSFLKKTTATGYLDDMDAVEAIESVKNQKPDNGVDANAARTAGDTLTAAAPNAATAGNDEGKVDWNRIKVNRFLALAKGLANDSESELGKHIFRTPSGLFGFAENKVKTSVLLEEADESMLADHTDENFLEPAVDRMQVDFLGSNKKDDILVYHEASPGGPALLVPGALLQSVGKVSTTGPRFDAEPMDFRELASNDTSNKMKIPLVGSTPGNRSASMPLQLGPPLAPTTTATTFPLPFHSAYQTPSVPPQPRIPAPVMPPPGFGVPAAPKLPQPHPVNPVPLEPLYQSGPNFSHMTVAESLNFFSDPSALPHTSNPFVTSNGITRGMDNVHGTSTTSRLFGSYSRSAREDTNFLVNDADTTTTTGLEGTPFVLDSSTLLSSLLRDNENHAKTTTTNNPFAH